MTGVVHLGMFTLLCNLVNTFLSIMCGHFYLVLSVTILGSDCVAPGMMVIILPPVLPVLLILLLPEDVTLSKGEADQGDSQDKGELHGD